MDKSLAKALAIIAVITFPLLQNAFAQCSTKEECAELKEYQEFLKQYEQQINEFEQSRTAEWESYLEQTRKEYQDYVANIQQVWGDDTILSDKKNWVEYSENLQTQVRVDYENNEITVKNVSGMSESDFRSAIKKEIKGLLKQTKKTANKDNPLKKNLNKIAASTEEKQVVSQIRQIYSQYAVNDDSKVLSEVEELTGQTDVDKQADALAKMAAINSKEVTYYSLGADQFADLHISPVMLAASSTKKKAMVGKISLSEKWTSLRAKKYKSYVDAFSKEWSIEKPLIYSIMFNESSFNPVAISPIPAYGLMQIVPKSAGVDVAQRHFKTEVLFSPDFLFEPQNNIAIGVGYLNLLDARYFRRIENPMTRMYCVIAAYNTGPGNVSRALTNTTKLNLAVAAANKMKPDQVYQRLLSDLPYDETINYLKKVTRSIKKFESI